MTKIVLQEGKYTIQHDNGANFKALRYGEEWRDLTGDGLVLALVQRIEELEEIVNKSKPKIPYLEISPTTIYGSAACGGTSHTSVYTILNKFYRK